MSEPATSPKIIEPPIQSNHRGMGVHGRWRHWYTAIADAMIRSPGKTQIEIATELGKSAPYVSMIINTDMFKEYFAQRKAEWRESHDHMLRAKLTDVASEGLDILLDQLKAKKGQTPMPLLTKVVEGTLDRLGYAPSSGPTVMIDNSVKDNRQVNVSVSAADLEAARNALRLVEQAKSGTSLAPDPVPRTALGANEAEGVTTLDLKAEQSFP